MDGNRTQRNVLDKILSLLVEANYIAAIPLARQFVENFPASAEGHFLLARALAESGDRRNALTAAEKACQLQPSNYQYLYYCGELYADFHLYEYALPHLRKSVTIQPKAFLSQLGLANCYFKLGNGGRAVEHYRKALQLSPPRIAKGKIRLELARCLIASGNRNEAIPLLKRLVEEGGEFVLSALYELAKIGKDGPESDIGMKLAGAVATGKYGDPELRGAYLALGQLQANASNHDAAFALWEKSREHAKADNWRLKNHQQVLAETRRFYAAELFNLCREHGHPSDAPVFIAGMPRSGTTLTEQILSAHSKVSGVGEVARWIQLDEALRLEYAGEGHIERIEKNAAAGELKRRAEEALAIFRAIANEAKARIVEKTPHNFMSIGYLALCFPNARYIHIRRHPADTFISCFQNNLNPSHGYAYDQVEFAKEYVFHERIMAHWKQLFPDRILTMQYESLIADPETQARRLLEFIGLPWEENCLRFFERAGTVRTLSMNQVRQPVYKSSINRWQVYQKHLGPLLQALADFQFTYPPPD